jgi:hypothetical protein
LPPENQYTGLRLYHAKTSGWQLLLLYDYQIARRLKQTFLRLLLSKVDEPESEYFLAGFMR